MPGVGTPDEVQWSPFREAPDSGWQRTERFPQRRTSTVPFKPPTQQASRIDGGPFQQRLLRQCGRKRERREGYFGSSAESPWPESSACGFPAVIPPD